MRTMVDLEQEVAAIGGLSREELVARWQKAYGCPPPKGINRPLLERSAAWHLQAKKLGGLSLAAKSALRAAPARVGHGGAAKEQRSSVATTAEAPSTRSDTLLLASASLGTEVERKPRSAAPAVGTRLLREWNGRMHVIDVTDQGVLFDGKIYRSLSSVAKRITGAHWSGPRFFGL